MGPVGGAPHHGPGFERRAGESIALSEQQRGPLMGLSLFRQAYSAPQTLIAPQTVGTPVSGPYDPAQIRHAYGIDQLGTGLDGTGQTIGIVDAYDDPTIASDLVHFDQQWGLPVANFTKVVPSTGTPASNSGWDTEIALDVEWAHVVAPGAKIVLVEAANNSLSNLLAAVDTAVSMGAKQVSMSWGGGDFQGENTFDYHFEKSGVTFLAASGDGGSSSGVLYPAVSPYVTAVGGTTISLDASGDRLTETAWSGSGGGTSAYEPQPSYAVGFNSGSFWGSPDVSYDADPGSGVYVYDTSNGGGWYDVGGTSAATPQWAGLIAIANEGRASASLSSLGTGLTYGTNQVLYQLAGGTSYKNAYNAFFDITGGSNGLPATVGYDLATGLGSPDAPNLIPALINPNNLTQPPPTPAATVTFVGTDTTTQGNWKGVYGGDGFDSSQDPSSNNPNIPAYASLTFTGDQNYTWSASTTDTRALRNRPRQHQSGRRHLVFRQQLQHRRQADRRTEPPNRPLCIDWDD